jgi:hypothetical protein
VAGRGRLNFRAPQAVPLGLQGPDGMDRQAVGDQLSAIENLQRSIADWATVFAPFWPSSDQSSIRQKPAPHCGHVTSPFFIRHP